MAERKFEYSDGKSFKFWNVERKGTQVVTRYGRIGTNGQEAVKDFPDEAKAIAGEEKLIKQKTSKGYEEVGGGGDGDQSGGGGRREFHFHSGSSSKFWAIEMKGDDSFDVNYGKIGTDGQTKTKEFKSAEAAQKAYDKLIAEKTSKGYEEVAGDGGGDSSSNGKLSEMFFSTTKNQDDIGEMSVFIGKRIVEYKDPKSIRKGNKHVYKFVVDWDSENAYEPRLKEFLASDAATEADAIVLGNWSPEPDVKPDFIVKHIVDNKDRLSGMLAVFFGEIAQEENEMSWIRQTDMGPLLAALPNLELLRTRGSDGLAFSKVKHDNLRALGVETGGLPKKVLTQICKAKLPKLEYLELWLGTDEYGRDCTVNDLQPILSGKAFPNLKYLGLRNADIADDIAGVLVNSPITRQVETLDLSLGTLSDEGGAALLDLPTDGNLKRLDVHYHFMSSAMVKKVKSLPFTVNASDRQEAEDWGDGDLNRFVAVGE